MANRKKSENKMAGTAVARTPTAATPAKKAKGKELVTMEDILGESHVLMGELIDGDAYSTGSSLVDLATDIDGFPAGQIVEVFGPPSSGKTTMILMAMAEAQRNGLTSIFLDYEGTFSKKYAQELGIDTEAPTFMLARPRDLERGFEIIIKMIHSRDDIAIIGVDSVAVMVPRKAREEDFNLDRVMLKAQRMSGLLEILRAEMNQRNTKTTVAFVNQIRTSPGMGPMGQTKENATPGGKALPFYATMRIEFKQIGTISEKVINEFDLSDEKRQVGAWIQATVVKNKAGNPFMRTRYICRSGYGVDIVGTIFELALSRKTLKLSGARVTIPAEYSITGQESNPYKKAALEYFRNNPIQFQKLEDRIVSDIKAAMLEREGEEIIEGEVVEQAELPVGSTNLNDLAALLGEDDE